MFNNQADIAVWPAPALPFLLQMVTAGAALPVYSFTHLILFPSRAFQKLFDPVDFAGEELSCNILALLQG